ncbi:MULTISPECIES: YoaK family protein [Enterococcus]|uniref:DUF1275 domain-containing protein n=1 Tax=Enterococcus alishanensis TaxID=1303817 RepID=A0ABS6TEE0_9ENTE|nr:YoaK family protein [Enterococcus alishanensis]MBV7391266.1 DUF1275 domain-containing protein [Enterococcus alishanensis]
MNNDIHNNEPYMSFPIIAFLLAVAAGGMDGYTYFIGKVFSTVQSGNIILLGQTLATKNWSHFFTVAATILAFGIGAAITAVIQREDSKDWSFKVLIIEIIILFLLSLNITTSNLSTMTICIIISFISGMQGNAFHKFGQDLVYGNVAVTLVVQNAFSYLMKGFFKQAGAFQKSALYSLILLGFGFGGWLGTLLTSNFGNKALWFPIIIFALIYLEGKHLEKKSNDKLKLNPAA